MVSSQQRKRQKKSWGQGCWAGGKSLQGPVLGEAGQKGAGKLQVLAKTCTFVSSGFFFCSGKWPKSRRGKEKEKQTNKPK